MKEERIMKWMEENREKISQEVKDKQFLTSVKEQNGLAEFYLLLGADVNANDNEAIKLEAERGNCAGILLLYRYGANLSYLDLTKPVREGRDDIVATLFNIGAEMKREYLMVAVKANLPKMVCLLLLYYKQEIDAQIMQLALGTSAKMVELLLTYVNGIFPATVLNNENGEWGYFLHMPLENLSMVLDAIEKKDEKVSEIMKINEWDDETIVRKGECPKRFIFRLKCALTDAVKQADYDKTCFLLEYLEGKGIKETSKSFTINEWNGLLSSNHPIEEVDRILELLEEHDIYPEEECSDRLKAVVYRRGSGRTLSFFRFEPDENGLTFAIMGKNQNLIEEILSMEIVKPTKEHIERAIQMCWPNISDESREILMMIVKFHDKNINSLY